MENIELEKALWILEKAEILILLFIMRNLKLKSKVSVNSTRGCRVKQISDKIWTYL